MARGTLALCATLSFVTLALHGCGGSGGGGGGSPTPAPTPAAPTGNKTIACGDAQKRAHCTGDCIQDYDTKSIYCTDCNQPYKINVNTGNCEVKCTDYLPAPDPKPAIPDTSTSLRGTAWPEVCFDDTDEISFFSIGDWGGMCGWPHVDHDDATLNLCEHPDKASKAGGGGAWRPSNAEPGKPWPMDVYKRLTPVDGIAQLLVADKMMDKFKEMKKDGMPPLFVINVGDSIYPGGIDDHCGNLGKNDMDAIVSKYQWAASFENVYHSDDTDFDQLEWWGVLGNHDYGGNCYIKAWDQMIYYTWKEGGRWVMPAQYWKRHVQFKRFDADFFFIDANINDVDPPSADPKHNICYVHGNDGSDDDLDYCKYDEYPPTAGAGESCQPGGGPANPDDCVAWFNKLWEDNKQWLTDELKKSTADWQIVVSHYPITFQRGMDWAPFAEEHGIDLIITGHQHRQGIYNRKLVEPKYSSVPDTNMGGTVHVVTGGGGGIQTDDPPHDDGEDDMYGYMVMKLSVAELKIDAYSHGGKYLSQGGKHVLRNTTTAPPVMSKSQLHARAAANGVTV